MPTIYTRSESVTIDNDLSGSFFIIVETDSGNQVYEGTNENNNRRVTTVATQVQLSPTADLRVMSVTPPDKPIRGVPRRCLGCQK